MKLIIIPLVDTAALTIQNKTNQGLINSSCVLKNLEKPGSSNAKHSALL